MAAQPRSSSQELPLPWTERHRSALASGAAAFGLSLGPAQLDCFHRYYGELIAWNQRANLTAITDPDAVLEKHFLDSLSCVLGFPPRPWEGLSLVDIGTGAGFPGIPLKLALPGLRLTLIESTGKKTQFLSYVVRSLGLEETAVLTGRAEDLGQKQEHREKSDIAVSRALAALALLAEYCLPFVRVGGRFIAPKRTGIEEEVAAGRVAISILGGKLLPPVRLPDPTRQLIVAQKVAPTPPAYPRRAGIPAKRPLGTYGRAALEP